jgi:hypothetical protein
MDKINTHCLRIIAEHQRKEFRIHMDRRSNQTSAECPGSTRKPQSVKFLKSSGRTIKISRIPIGFIEE